MPDAHPAIAAARLPELGPEWQEAADLAAHNLGFGSLLSALCPEHWQLVLASVNSRMLLRGTQPPPGWQTALAKQIGRHEATSQGENPVVSLKARRERTNEAPQT